MSPPAAVATSPTLSARQMLTPRVDSGNFVARGGIYSLVNREAAASDEIQDAAAIVQFPRGEMPEATNGRRVAAIACVADGASGAPLSASWARHLAGSYVASIHTYSRFEDWFRVTRDSYPDPSRSLHKVAKDPFKQQFWRLGSQSTLAGLILFDDGAYEFHCCGDTILVHLPKDPAAPLTLIPIAAPEGFPRSPDLLIGRTDVEPMAIQRFSGRYRPGDRLLLASDGLGHVIVEGHAADPVSTRQTLAAVGRPAGAFAGPLAALLRRVASDVTGLAGVIDGVSARMGDAPDDRPTGLNAAAFLFPDEVLRRLQGLGLIPDDDIAVAILDVGE